MGGDIPVDNASSADDHIVSDGDSGENGAVCTDPDMAADGDGQGNLQPSVPLPRIDGVTSGGDDAVGSNEDGVTDGDPATI